jgi:hypothetical protein
MINASDPVGFGMPRIKSTSRGVWYRFARSGQRRTAPRSPNSEPSDKLKSAENKRVSVLKVRRSYGPRLPLLAYE